MSNWFNVDKEGLAKLLADRSPAHILFELVSNAWDTKAKIVEVSLESIDGRAVLVVGDDDPDGFVEISDAWTLFAESRRKGDAEKRGRFCIGEKFVLACCLSAEIVTTRGGVRFDKEGRRLTKSRTAVGSVFRAALKMTRSDVDRAIADFKRVIPPNGVITRMNSRDLHRPEQIHVFDAMLPTVRIDDDGNLRRSERKGIVRLFRPRPGETPTLYEMGIPVVELDGGEHFHVEVSQKVPLNTDRDNVTPAFLRALRVSILNATRDETVRTQDDASRTWVRDAASDRRCDGGAIDHVLDKRFGEKRVSASFRDPEANHRAVAEGYVLVHGGSLSAGEWENARVAGAIVSAERVTPSHMSAKPTSDYTVVQEGDQTVEMRRVVELSKKLALDVLGLDVAVRVIESPAVTSYASWDRDQVVLTFNASQLGLAWFETLLLPPSGSKSSRRVLRDEQVELLLHELAHHRGGSNHLADEYHGELCRLGTRLARCVGTSGWQEVDA